MRIQGGVSPPCFVINEKYIRYKMTPASIGGKKQKVLVAGVNFHRIHTPKGYAENYLKSRKSIKSRVDCMHVSYSTEKFFENPRIWRPNKFFS